MSPEQVHLLFADYFSAGNLEGLISLYEPEAAFVRGLGESIRGHARIREVLFDFLERGGRMDLKIVAAYTADDLALLLSDWTIYRETLEKREVISSGRTSDVVRRQSDGSWLLVIDNPDGVAPDATEA